MFGVAKPRACAAGVGEAGLGPSARLGAVRGVRLRGVAFASSSTFWWFIGPGTTIVVAGAAVGPEGLKNLRHAACWGAVYPKIFWGIQFWRDTRQRDGVSQLPRSRIKARHPA